MNKKERQVPRLNVWYKTQMKMTLFTSIVKALEANSFITRNKSKVELSVPNDRSYH